MRRLTRRERLKEQVRSLDVFPKVEPEVQQRTSGGGLTTFVVATIILFLMVSEFMYYRTVDVRYDYAVDTDMRRDMNLTMDITIAMDCKYLGADYIDISSNSSDAMKWLKADAAHFQLTAAQEAWVASHRAKTYREDSLERFLVTTISDGMPEDDGSLTTPPDSCRIHGTMPINKVAANFHITAGKSIHHARGHSHMSNHIPPQAVNFSHRIDHLSFSERLEGTNVLDGEVQTSDENQMMFQYFLKVVPSVVSGLGREPYRCNQFSVQENTKSLRGQRAMSGIFFKIDLEAISVHIYEERRSFTGFLVGLCGIVGGIITTSGMLHRGIETVFEGIFGGSASAPATT